MSLGYSLLHSMVDYVGNWTSNEQVLCLWPAFFLFINYRIFQIDISCVNQVSLQQWNKILNDIISWQKLREDIVSRCDSTRSLPKVN